MPVQKFRSLEEAERALWTKGGSEENLRRLSWLYRLSADPGKRPIQRGVQRYRSNEEANSARFDWDQDPLRVGTDS